MIAPGAGLSVSRHGALLGIARSSLYYRPRSESAEELELLKRLDRMFTDNPVYGSRRLQVALLRERISVGRRRVRGLMRKLGRGRSGRTGTPATGIPGTRSTLTFCAGRRSTRRTKACPREGGGVGR